jgi:RNA polymerase sigma factor (sigma-70 family)
VVTKLIQIICVTPCLLNLSNNYVTAEKEQIIIKNIVAGDAQAFAVLINTYKDMAVLLAYSILLNQEDAEEVAQDAFLKAYCSLHSFKADARFSTWFYRIVVNTALNKKKLKKHYPIEITESLSDELPFGNNNIPASQITGEQRKHIQFALKSINANERLCLTLYYLNELSVEEIHKLTKITTSNIKVLLYRGRKNLYTALHRHLRNEITNLIKQ